MPIFRTSEGSVVELSDKDVSLIVDALRDKANGDRRAAATLGDDDGGHVGCTLRAQAERLLEIAEAMEDDA